MMLPLLIDLPGRDQAREAAQRELARPEYGAAQPSWVVRLVTWVLNELQKLLDKASGAVPGGTWGLVLLALLTALVIAVVLVRLRPATRRPAVADLFGLDRQRTAQDHRELAERAAREGRWADAVRERLRAVVRELEARGVLEPRPGRTADEIASEAGSVVPELAGQLAAAARLFDEVWYGGRAADDGTYAVLVDLDRRVTAVRLVLA